MNELTHLRGRRVLLTGHTGFKGGWLAVWLNQLGAHVVGIALPPATQPTIYESCRIGALLDGRYADIAAQAEFDACVGDFDAEIVIHMAAQALVRPSYAAPIATYMTNVIGTAVVLEAARRMPSLRAVIVVTSDKCYENNEWVWGYRETDPMGGFDPYSSSKGCTELVAAAYRRSFFNAPGGPQLATVRAGNVIGGGDWAEDRLVPDLVRAAVSGRPVTIRNPASVRPWQHVLDPLHGYLMLAAALMREGEAFAGAWNFGPDPDGTVSVGELAERFRATWGRGAPPVEYGQSAAPHEAHLLRLDTAKARNLLGWRPRLDLNATLRMTVDWYRAHSSGGADLRSLSQAQVKRFCGAAPSDATMDDTMGDQRQCA